MKVNGQQVPFTGTVTLGQFLEGSGYDCRRVAVERNGEIVPRARYGETLLCSTDSLEVVSFVGGG